ncbi:uncharacterized protein UBRO_20852 [Ustilago bromivora]|uniref:Uncharacterized protein n=1 Tax=Ustilago bromivora TaxID=307758 RepID=A0A1K0GAA1_9BASI|nr:uncharacterized protein UBRO_20852 [Ustilago bromivora]
MPYALRPCSKRPVATEPSAAAPKPPDTSSVFEAPVPVVETTGTPSGSAPLEPLFLFADKEADPTSRAASIISFGSPPVSPAPDVINNDALRRRALPTPCHGTGCAGSRKNWNHRRRDHAQESQDQVK